jgi:hypothetical protein
MAVANVPINILNAHSSHAIWGFQSMFFLKVFLAKKCCHTTLKQQVPYYIIYYKGSRYLLTEWSVCYRDWNCLRSVAAPRPFWTGQKFAQFWHLSNTKCKDCSTFRAKSCKDKGVAAILLHTTWTIFQSTSSIFGRPRYPVMLHRSGMKNSFRLERFVSCIASLGCVVLLKCFHHCSCHWKITNIGTTKTHPQQSYRWFVTTKAYESMPPRRRCKTSTK